MFNDMQVMADNISRSTKKVVFVSLFLLSLRTSQPFVLLLSINQEVCVV